MKRRYADERRLNQFIAKAAIGAGVVGLAVLLLTSAV